MRFSIRLPTEILATNRPNKIRYYGAMLAAFVAANLAVLMPDTWRYCVQYVQGTNLVHHGYLYAGPALCHEHSDLAVGCARDVFNLRLLATKVPPRRPRCDPVWDCLRSFDAAASADSCCYASVWCSS